MSLLDLDFSILVALHFLVIWMLTADRRCFIIKIIGKEYNISNRVKPKHGTAQRVFHVWFFSRFLGTETPFLLQ